jgi:hypothetical protein
MFRAQNSPTARYSAQTRSACFRLRGAPRWLPFQKIIPRGSMTWSVQVAIIRPGPIVGKMMHPYMRRRQGKEEITYPHPSLEPVLGRTLGVPLFPEQLLRMAMTVANFHGRGGRGAAPRPLLSGNCGASG